MTTMDLGCWNVLETNWAEIERLERHWPEGLGLHVRFNSPLYNSYPYFLAPAFPPIPDESLRLFSLAGMLYSQSLFIFDRFIDEGAPADSAKLAGRILGWQFEAHSQLRRLFPHDEPFWDRFRSYVADFTRACLDERRATTGVTPWQEFTEQRVVDLAIGKAGVARTVVAGLVSFSGDEREAHVLLESINDYNVAMQYMDDLIDWRKDLALGTPSLLLIRLLNDRPSRALTPKDMDRLGREVHYGGHARYMLESVMSRIDAALAIVSHLPLGWWREQLDQLRRRAEVTLEDLDFLVLRNVKRLQRSRPFVYRPPAPRSEWERTAWSALEYIIAQSRRGFGEVRHIMQFARSQGFRGERDHQAGDVFQRAIIADALCDADDVLAGDLWPLIRTEAEHLIEQRRREGVGGWAYFPDLPDLSSDADDLAQVIQVLVRSGMTSEAEALCTKPLEVLFNDCTHDDGSFETWIIPAKNRSELEEHQLDAAIAMWGTGPDVEVIANLVYALATFAPHRFEPHTERALGYIESAQKADGSWSSSWYHGPFYGTYVCLRALVTLRPESRAIERALDYLRASQRSDGSWAIPGQEREQGDALSTSLALLGLATGQQAGATNADDVARARHALAYVESVRDATGPWPAATFIRMNIKGGARNGPPQLYAYGSRTITTTYVMKAAVAWHRLAGAEAPVSSAPSSATLELTAARQAAFA